MDFAYFRIEKVVTLTHMCSLENKEFMWIEHTGKKGEAGKFKPLWVVISESSKTVVLPSQDRLQLLNKCVF